jgi:hypothetical protein
MPNEHERDGRYRSGRLSIVRRRARRPDRRPATAGRHRPIRERVPIRRVDAALPPRPGLPPDPLHHLRIRLRRLLRPLELLGSLDLRRNVRLANHTLWRSPDELLELQRDPAPLTIVERLPVRSLNRLQHRIIERLAGQKRAMPSRQKRAVSDQLAQRLPRPTAPPPQTKPHLKTDETGRNSRERTKVRGNLTVSTP